ncbi:AraC family transcriptional regulator [Sphingomonas sp. GlSt437]|uniref:AraC family transcriptional regulator n=1 Tax=Sphingomonas sp. GlSt437 TaxID=3389970 RepID=UPI003A840169
MDYVLKDVLDTVSITTAFYFRTDFRKPYAIRVPAYESVARFHMAFHGYCQVRIDDGTVVDLGEGDLVLVPNGASHVLACGGDAPEILLEDAFQRTGYEGHGPFVFGYDGEADGCQLICGHFAFAKGADHPLLALLPSIVHIPAARRRALPLLDEMSALIGRQVFNDDPDATASFGRLSEALFIEILRAASHDVPRLATLFAAISDPHLGRALAAIHANVGAQWTVEALAGHAAMSRTRFAERFRALVGLSPMAYLTEWRLQRGLKLLADGQLPVKTVAAQVGYTSPAAFSRAFSERFGHSPSSVGRAPAAA